MLLKKIKGSAYGPVQNPTRFGLDFFITIASISLPTISSLSVFGGDLRPWE